MLLADARVDETRTFLRPLVDDTAAEMHAFFDQMEDELTRSFAREIGAVEVAFERQGLLRFRRQRDAIKVSIARGDDCRAVRRTFEATYRQRYGYLEPELSVEFIGLAVSAAARVSAPRLADLRPSGDGGAVQAATRRPVDFAERGGRVETPVLQRVALPIGFAANGPAVIEEYGSTTVVGPDDRFGIGALGE